MKTNKTFTSRIVGTILLVSTVVGWTKISAAQSVDSSFNGLFTPTQAQQFFESGRRKLETETEFYRPKNILDIEGVNDKERDEPQQRSSNAVEQREPKENNFQDGH